MFHSGRTFLATAAVLAAVALPAGAGAGELASYRAVYDISLDPTADGGADVGEISGRVVSEFTGSPCAGYKAAMRFVMAVENEDGGRQITDTRTTSFEDSGGKALDFSNQTYIDERLTSDSSGKAKRTGKGIVVSLVKPAAKHLDLASSVIFPTQQIEQILGAAMEGKSFLDASIYDGTDDGQKAFATAAVIGHQTIGANADEPAAAGLAGLRRWPVTVSYFDAPEAGEQTAAQVMSFALYENGVQGNIKINYGSFSVALHMTKLEILPASACP